MSPDKPNGGRLHDPSLQELTADLDGLRELMLAKFEAIKEIIDERDERYKERAHAHQEAMAVALVSAKEARLSSLTAIKEQTEAAFNASEKAISKAEAAQTSYNQSHNDLARKMDEQNKATMPRSETESRFKALEEKMAILTGSFVAGTGAAQGAREVKDETRANISIVISIVAVVLTVLWHFATKGVA